MRLSRNFCPRLLRLGCIQWKVEMQAALQRRPLLEELRQRGVRLTAQRRVLIEEIQNAEQHLDAALLCERVRKRAARVDRATVYRTLGLLKRMGLIDELDLMHLNGEKHYYEARTRKDHLHLACFRCGSIQELTSEHYERLKEDIRKNLGFSIDVIRLEVGGRCRDCATGQSSASCKI
jgi:Fur family ferric uptake transcriptional regulator